MTSATSTRAIRAAQARAAADAANERSVIEAMMADVKGRRWVWNKLAAARLFTEDQNFDPYHMAYAKGLRNEGLKLLNAVIRFSPTLYVRMTEENTGVDLTTQDEEETTDDG